MKLSATTRILFNTSAALTLAALSLSAQARANDGGIAWGGSPSLLKSHPSVSMQSELVQITIGEDNVLVDCRFVFQNHGPATSVRMGFPDEGSGDDNADEDGSQGRQGKPMSNFKWFKSWVDGAPAKTELVLGPDPGQSWHAKTVSFAPNAKRVVRDQYSVPVGSQIARDGVYWQAAYTLRTGSSWKGPIGRSEIVVRFSRPLQAARVRAIPLSKVPFEPEKDSKGHVYESADYLFARAMKPGVVVVSSGPGLPRVSGKTLRWVKTNWRPAKQDDIHLMFGFQSFAQLQKQSKSKPQ